MQLGGVSSPGFCLQRGSERSKEETVRLLEPIEILWGLFYSVLFVEVKL